MVVTKKDIIYICGEPHQLQIYENMKGGDNCANREKTLCITKR